MANDDVDGMIYPIESEEETAEESYTLEHTDYLLFSLHGSRYAVDAFVVREILWLPELTLVAETPGYIVGVFNLRGNIVPVMDVTLRFGYTPKPYCQTDSVIVIEWEGVVMGIIVNEILDVVSISEDAIGCSPSEGKVTGDHPSRREEQISPESGVCEAMPIDKRQTAKFGSVPTGSQVDEAPPRGSPPGIFRSCYVAGVARVDEDLVMVLNHHRLIRYLEPVEALIPDKAIDTLPSEVRDERYRVPESTDSWREQFIAPTKAPGYFCPEVSPEDREVLHRRARDLMQATESQDFTGQVPIVVVGLSGEYFAVDLDKVRKFAEIRNVTPIPCCPEHIVGNINLDGDILTVVDIRSVLKMPIVDARDDGRVIVIEIDNLPVGVFVEEVFDVVYLRPKAITRVPSTVQSISEEYIKGTHPYGEKEMLSILDLPKILMDEDLIVNEDV